MASIWALLYLATKTIHLQRNVVVDHGKRGRRDRLESKLCPGFGFTSKVAVLGNFDAPKITMKYGSCFVLQKHDLGK